MFQSNFNLEWAGNCHLMNESGVSEQFGWKIGFIFKFFLFFYSVQESDGSYFESFTALSWKRENRRMSAIRAAEARAEILPENEKEPPGQGQVHVNEDDAFDNPEQREQLYLDVLHTITNTVGAPAPGGQVS